jgi:hypothetical protein
MPGDSRVTGIKPDDKNGTLRPHHSLSKKIPQRCFTAQTALANNNRFEKQFGFPILYLDFEKKIQLHRAAGSYRLTFPFDDAKRRVGKPSARNLEPFD